MGVNFDVSLFGLPGVGSNRVEEGFVVDEGGMIILSDFDQPVTRRFSKAAPMMREGRINKPIPFS